MKEQLRGIRAAERLLRDPLRAVDTVLAAEALPARLTPETDWLSRSPLAAVPLPAREVRSDSSIERSAGSRGRLKPRAGENGGRTDRPGTADAHPSGARRGDAAIQPGGWAPSVPLPALGAPDGGRGAPANAGSHEPHLPVRTSAGESPGRHASPEDGEGGPVISLRRIGANSRKLTTGTELQAGDRAAARRDGGSRVTPARPLAQVTGAAPRSGSGAPPTVPLRSPDRPIDVTVSQSPVLGSVIERVSARAESALARRQAGSAASGDAPAGRAASQTTASPEPIRPPFVGTDRIVDGGALRSVSSDGSMRPPPRFAPMLEVERPRVRTAAAQADPDWVLEVIGEALADQARREGIDLS